MRCRAMAGLGVLLAMSALVGCSDDRAEGGAGSGASSAGSGATSGGGGIGGGGGGTSGSNAPTGPVPMFPGAGNSDDALPLAGGMVCDEVPGSTLATVNVTRCFFGPNDRMNPAATIEQVLECVEGSTALHLRLTFAPSFVDNTYGVNQIGWSTRRGHTFRDLVGSDHAELVLMDGDGEVAMQFKMDYISADPDAPSGYSALGVTGGEGEVAIGNPDHIVDASTSLDRNLNDRGYSSYIVDSPATDASYAANLDTPDWDYRVVFDVWVDLEAFGDAGFAGAFIEYVHASPAKAEDSTIETTPDECPPEWDPCLDENPDTTCNDYPPGDDPCLDENPDTYCDDPCFGENPPAYCSEPPTDNPCADNRPDTYCADGSEPNNPEPPYCERYPSDPSCMPE